MHTQINSHKTPGLNSELDIAVLDGPGQGGACHEYHIINCEQGVHAVIRFQNGPIEENGINGITNESLLAVVEHRLQGFQSGQFACRENAVALTKLQEAMMWLQKRTRDRLARGVEGSSQQ